MKKYRPSMAVNRSIDMLDRAIQERARKNDDPSVHSRRSTKSHKSAATIGNFDTSGSVKSRRSTKSAATTGNLKGRRKTKYREEYKVAKPAPPDPDGENTRSFQRSASIDPPTEIRVVESAEADWNDVRSMKSSLRDSKSSFSLGKILKSESFRKKQSSTSKSTGGDANSKSKPSMRLTVKILRAITSKNEDARSMPSEINSRRATHYRAETPSARPKRTTRIIPTAKAGRGLRPTDPAYADVQSIVSENDLRRIRKSTFQPQAQNEAMSEKGLEPASATHENTTKATLFTQDDQPQSNQTVDSEDNRWSPSKTPQYPNLSSADTTATTADIISLHSNHKVNFKPTTITRYAEDSLVSHSAKTVTTCDVDSLGKNITMERKKMKKKKKNKKHRSRSKEQHAHEENKRHKCRVEGYPYTELKTGIHGTYSGPVNEIFQPDGEGEFSIQNIVDGSRFQFKGTVWENGSMVSNQLLLFHKMMEFQETNNISRDRSTEFNDSNVNGERTNAKMHIISDYNDTDTRSSSKKKKKHRKKSKSDADSKSGSKKKKKRSKVQVNDLDSVSNSKSNEQNDSEDHAHSKSSSKMTVEEKLDPKLISNTGKNRQSALLPMKNNQDTQHIEINSTLSEELKNTPFEYSLGVVARSRSEMLVAATPTLALQATSSIKIHEKAFLQRSNGLWTVAILADRSFQPFNSYRISSKWYKLEEIDDSAVLEECLLFVINSQGGTKIVPKKYWGRCVRKINPECYDKKETKPKAQKEKCDKQQQIANACSDIRNITKNVRDDIKKTHPNVPLVPLLHSSTDSSSVGSHDKEEAKELDDLFVRKVSGESSSW